MRNVVFITIALRISSPHHITSSLHISLSHCDRFNPQSLPSSQYAALCFLSTRCLDTLRSGTRFVVNELCVFLSFLSFPLLPLPL